MIMKVATAPASEPDQSDESGVEPDLEGLEACAAQLRVPAPPEPPARRRLRDLLPLVLPALRDQHAAPLADYLAVLRAGDARRVRAVTHHVIAAVEDALRQGDELGEQRLALCALLSAAALADEPRAPDARAALRQLLPRTAAHERELLAAAWWRALPPAALLALSDAVRAPRESAPDPAPSLAELLLRAALGALAGDAEPQWARGVPTLEELAALLGARERRRPSAAAQDAERVALSGRVLAVAPPALRPALLARLSDARIAALGDQPPAARADRKVGVCKLQIMFESEDRPASGRARAPKPPAPPTPATDGTPAPPATDGSPAPAKKRRKRRH